MHRLGYISPMTRLSSSHIPPIARFGVALLLVFMLQSGPIHAEDAALDAEFRDLANPDFAGWERTEADIRRAWSHSGSAAMDLLLKRGEDALDSGDPAAAIDHLTALTDHAPDFAEGWNVLASAYIATGRYGPAVDALAKALTREPRQWEALTALGGILEEIGDEPRALAAYKASFALNPHQQDVKDALTRLETSSTGTAL